MKGESNALPSRFYGDPVDVVDERIKITKEQERQAELHRIHKGRRIRALVKEALKNGGGNHGSR